MGSGARSEHGARASWGRGTLPWIAGGALVAAALGVLVGAAGGCGEQEVGDALPSASDGGVDGTRDDGSASCGPGLVICDGRCVDAVTDPEHCGVCGHSCGGGACKDGLCQTAVIARGLNIVRSLTQDRDNLYLTANNFVPHDVISGPPRLLRIPKAGEPCVGLEDRCTIPVPYLDDAGVATPVHVAVGRDRLWVGITSLGLAELDLLAGGWSLLGGTSGYSRAFPTADALYVFGVSAPQVRRLDWDGGTPDGSAEARFSVPSFGAALIDVVAEAEGDGVVMAVAGTAEPPDGLYRFPKTGGPPCEGLDCRVDDHRIVGVAVKGGWRYQARNADLPGEIAGRVVLERVRHDGTCEGAAVCPEPVLTGVVFGFFQFPFALDEQHIYWPEQQSEGRYALRRLPLGHPCNHTVDGAACGEVVFEGPKQIAGLVVDDGFVYALVTLGTELESQVWKRSKGRAP